MSTYSENHANIQAVLLLAGYTYILQVNWYFLTKPGFKNIYLSLESHPKHPCINLGVHSFGDRGAKTDNRTCNDIITEHAINYILKGTGKYSYGT